MNSYRWHRHIKPGTAGPMVSNAALHLQQGDMDSLCGPLCALMALGSLKLADVEDIHAMDTTTDQSLRSFWQNCQQHTFTGSKPTHLRRLFAAYPELSVTTFCAENHLTGTIDSLEGDGLAILGISNDELKHWVLVIGIGGQEKPQKKHKENRRFLILDPSYPAISLCPWNALLDLKADKHGIHRYSVGDQAIPVLVTVALGLARLDSNDLAERH